MRGLISPLIHSAVVAFVALLAGCESNLPTPVTPDPPGPIVVERDPSPDATPKVVRRLVAEAQEQLGKDRAMVNELQDARGRARAQSEAEDLDRELSSLAQRADNPDSDNLDDVMNRLQLLDTRIDIFHEKLRAATERSTAVVKD
jgi:hypothetical protein